MSEPWALIADRYRREVGEGNDAAFARAMRGVADLAAHIETTALRDGLFGWTSMHDLCIQQTDQQPYSGPHLRISPLPSGNVEFRYVDTMITARQWHREVAAEDTVSRFDRFLDELNWVARHRRTDA